MVKTTTLYVKKIYNASCQPPKRKKNNLSVENIYTTTNFPASSQTAPRKHHNKPFLLGLVHDIKKIPRSTLKQTQS